jgi:hypothetical protein
MFGGNRDWNSLVLILAAVLPPVKKVKLSQYLTEHYLMKTYEGVDI